MDWNNWYKEHRSNFFFWLLGTLGSGSVMGAIGHAIANSMHGHPTDWVLFGCFVVFGLILFFAVTFNRKKSRLWLDISNPEVDCLEEQIHASSHSNYDLLSPLQMEALTLSRDLGKFLADAEPYPAAPLNPSFDDAYDHYRGKGYDWGIRFRANYDAHFSARVKNFVSHLEIEKGRVNSILREGFEGVHTTEMIDKLQGELWREAMYAADVDFNKE